MSVGMPLDGSASVLRIAPKQGYDTLSKAAYRRAVWDCFAEAIPNLGSAKVLILPSHEGLEIETAMARGVPAESIVAVDKSAAVIATSKWRKAHPTIRFHAADIATVGKRLEGDAVAIANLDLCGRVSEETVHQVRQFLRTCPRTRVLHLGLTVAKGREGTVLTTLLKHIGHLDDRLECSRMNALCLMADITNTAHAWEQQQAKVLGQGTYTSGRHPMTWAVLRLTAFNDQWMRETFSKVRELAGAVDEAVDSGEPADALMDLLVDAEREAGITKDGELPPLPHYWHCIAGDYASELTISYNLKSATRKLRNAVDELRRERIEARRAETAQTGSVHESRAPEGGLAQ